MMFIDKKKISHCIFQPSTDYHYQHHTIQSFSTDLHNSRNRLESAGKYSARHAMVRNPTTSALFSGVNVAIFTTNPIQKTAGNRQKPKWENNFQTMQEYSEHPPLIKRFVYIIQIRTTVY